MKAFSAQSIRTWTTVLAAISMIASLAVASRAMAAAPDTSALAAKYATWAGGRENAQAIVNGLAHGSSITLVSSSRGHGRNLAGFTPKRALAPDEIADALANAQKTLSRLGINKPNAEQIQAALIGGEVTLPNGRTRELAGAVPIPGSNASAGPIAAR